jgi:beta-glucosidase
VGISRSDFPPDFAWGTATASYQNEGAVNEDGRGNSIWDVFARSHGAINDGTTGDVAVDHYHRSAEDVELMADLGLNSYRFSIAWPRVQPLGSGAVNAKGLAFYRNLAEDLLDHGITPYATLYHWDLPQALEDDGGWMARETALRFADYAGIVADELGDVIGDWITLNEPWCSTFLGYASGDHAPGKHLGARCAQAAHHLLLGHGRAVAAIRAARPDARVGITLNLSPTSPATSSAADADAARRIDGLANRLFLDPVLTGKYPEDVLDDLGLAEWFGAQPAVDLEEISTSLDFAGINYYFRYTVAEAHEFSPQTPGYPTSSPVRFVETGAPRTQMGWPVTPDGIIDAMRMVHERKPGLPLYITENGAAADDLVTDGEIHDEDRRAFIEAHLEACRTAIQRGIPLRGYFIWTLMDNFEWAWGFQRRFGLVRVDAATQARTVKDSGKWLKTMLHADEHPQAPRAAAAPERLAVQK